MFFGGDFGGSFGGAPRSRGPVDNSKLYKILEVDKNCSDAELKKSYRKLAMKHHPDKGGDTEKFQEISHAFEVLSDPEKRKIYDEAGEEGLEAGGMGGHGDGMDIFDMFFNGGRGGKSRGPQKTESVQTKMDISLEQLYKGCSKQLAVSKDVLCKTCNGHGGPKDKIVVCDGCNGNGFRVKMVRMGPMVSQSRSPCDMCEQQGKYIPSRFRCKTCNGNKVTKEKKVLMCEIEPGCSDGKRIVFEGESDQRPDTVPGDVIVVINELKNPNFERQKDDLIITKDIDITDVICGFSFLVTALDGRKLLIKVKPGLIRSSNEAYVMVDGEGMPKSGNQHIRGHLIVKFNVKFPTETPKNIGALKKLLVEVPGCKGLPTIADDDGYEICYSKPYIPMQHQSSNTSASQAYDEDMDGHGGHQQGVQCQTQ